MTKHTPGPWHVRGKDHFPHVDYDPRKPSVVAQTDTYIKWIAHCTWGWEYTDYPDATQANARLIAAAPDLLDACILAREKISGVEDVFDELAIELDTAIAKATGEGD